MGHTRAVTLHILDVGKELLAVVVFIGTSICLLAFFLDLVVTIPFSLFPGSMCFPEGPFLSSREATDVTVAPCLAT